MTRSVPTLGSAAVALALTILAPAVAAAQVGPQGGLPTGGPGGEEGGEKKDGVAESAPKTPGLLPTTPTLPPPKGKRTKFELFELDGYFRMRGDYFKNFNLSFRDFPEQGGSPFPRPLACSFPTAGTAGDAANRPCEDNVKSTNLRLRLEPTINVSETISVHTQIDVLDNYVLGSTPLADEQSVTGGSPYGDDAIENAIKVRRAWAEVETPLGVIKFGRQPSHWGLGIFQNAGGEDPIHGGYDLDSDYGDTVDRLMFGTLIPGTRLRGAIAMDWPRTFPASSAFPDDPTLQRRPQPWDLDDNDDVTQWVLVLSRIDDPEVFQATVDRGELGLNYGAYFTYRTQGWTYASDVGDPEPGTIDPDNGTDSPNADLFVPRASTLYIPDAWVRLGYKDMLFEAEALMTFGTIERLTDLAFTEPVDVRQWGGVGRFTYRALESKLKFGIEVGAASGDDWDNDVEGQTHLSHATFGVGDTTMSRFAFDPDYAVDLILFRELIGAVSNAAYGKPFLSYQITNSIGLKVSNVTSFALRKVSTPGNGSMYGTEFDADVGFTSGAFHAGLAYGVLFPLSAMDHPEDPTSGGGFTYDDPLSGFSDDNTGSAGNAHTLQMRLAVKF